MDKLEQIKVRYTDRAVHITADEELREYLKQERKDDARKLADYILLEYERRFEKPLVISRESLAVEILIHVFADRLMDQLLNPHSVITSSLKNVLEPALLRVKRSTEVIDCGERAVDTNRFVFDALAPFCDVISKILE